MLLRSCNFNPRSLTGATRSLTLRSILALFQSTLPYGSDIELTYVDAEKEYISIHAPLRERPKGMYTIEMATSISIHAPLRERLPEMQPAPQWQDFNPRSLTGATYVQKSEEPHLYDFNPRSLTGATGSPQQSRTEQQFQSTLPYGSDACTSARLCSPVLFQSTLPYGSDQRKYSHHY